MELAALPALTVEREEVTSIPPEGDVVLATGPLTSAAMAAEIQRLLGSDYLYFYDAIAPILAAVRSPRMGRKPAHWTRVDRDYERIRIDMQTLFTDLAIETPLAA